MLTYIHRHPKAKFVYFRQPSCAHLCLLRAVLGRCNTPWRNCCRIYVNCWPYSLRELLFQSMSEYTPSEVYWKSMSVFCYIVRM